MKVAQAKLQVETLARNVKVHQIPYLGLNSTSQGIVHVIGPELGFTLPGTTVVCGDSHTSTHGAFGCLAFGIGTSEVEHVLATQTVSTTKWKSILVWVQGTLAEGVGSKDLMLYIIGEIGEPIHNVLGGTSSHIKRSDRNRRRNWSSNRIRRAHDQGFDNGGPHVSLQHGMLLTSVNTSVQVYKAKP